MSRRLTAGAGVAALLAAASAAALASSSPAAQQAVAAGSAPGLPTVASGPRPGPDVLYAPATDAPQLQDAGVWTAPPILVSGADSYRNGEYVYQDFLNDDHGALGNPDSTTPYDTGDFLFSPVQGTYTYPTETATYANNLADLVEFRAKPLADSTAFRLTLNSMTDPSLVAATVALGTSAASVAWPDRAGVSSPAQYFLTWHGGTAAFTDATGRAVGTAPVSVSVDTVRRQVTLAIPHTDWNPGTATVPMTVGTGLWDTAGARYLVPGTGSATATTPGGGTALGVAIVNVGPRLHETTPTAAGQGYDIGSTAAVGTANASMWREEQQARSLATGDVSPFVADVDFAKLSAGTQDDRDIPTTGPIDRILASASVHGQGLDPTKVCDSISASISVGAACVGRFVAQLQSYALYIPTKPMPAQGWAMTLLLHSLSANYNQYLTSSNQVELGNEGSGSLVATPNGRGPDGFNGGVAEADDFEVWSDVARHYALDGSRAVVSGYSMGGYGTYQLAARWPDLFSRAFAVVGIPGAVKDQLPSLRNLPFMAWNSQNDELVPATSSLPNEMALAAAGLRFTQFLFNTADHLTLATNDEYQPGADFLGDDPVDRSPAHVTYVVNTANDNSTANVVANHAYWLSGLTLQDPTMPTGTIDVRSEAFGTGDPVPSGVANGASTLNGGAHGPMPYESFTQTWGATPVTPRADVLDITGTNIAAVTIDPARAQVDCNVVLKATSATPVKVTLTGCQGVRTVQSAPAAPTLTNRPAAPTVATHRTSTLRVGGRGPVRPGQKRSYTLRVFIDPGAGPAPSAAGRRLGLYVNGKLRARLVTGRDGKITYTLVFPRGSYVVSAAYYGTADLARSTSPGQRVTSR